MDTMEATNKVLSRIQTLDPHNASKILGYILIREHGDKDVIRLAHGPDAVLLSLISEVKARLGLSSSAASPPSPSLGPFSQASLRITIPNNAFQFHSSPPLSPWSNASPVSHPTVTNASPGRPLPFCSGDAVDQFRFLDESSPAEETHHQLHKQRCSANEAEFAGDSDDGALGVRPCMYNPPRKLLHAFYGSPTKQDASFDDFLRMKAHHLQHQRLHYPLTYNNNNTIMSNLNENPRLAPAPFMIGEELQRFGHCPLPEVPCDFSGVSFDGYSDACLRQIYLTFPADSTFSEEDVSNYFSIYGPVHDVRIPYQQKRMFGFVTFVYPETVKLILAKGNPHFVCDCRVLVKPYKEKGKILEKNRKQQQHHMDLGKLSACLSPSGLDSREPYDLPFGPRMFNSSQEALLRRKLEKEAELQKAIDLHSRRLMDLQLLDVKNKEKYSQFQCSSSPVFPVSCQSNSQSSNYEITEENNGSHEASAAGQENNSGSEDNPELHKRGLEHILPGKIVAAAFPSLKSAAENLPTGTDDSFSPTPFSNNTPTLLGTSPSIHPLFNHVT
ncbi:PREDICTED: zinc finger CCCH domain-containing protein 22-like isoform X2 [Ipomoea nil]|uniref:zinc finger CCCH domain-containing protein 22-like isoform X2 n=1 Tax=Ipomoea nil TaxID=35883 RepID=UPI000901362D|nr:PREDICTED: zinc finger CCCH domain-containing protein 22-like isoform X2 [Ipomoea nil]